MAVTRRQIRRSVARMLSDYYEVTAVGGGPTQTTQVTDPTGLARESGFFNGMQLYFADEDSPNYGTIATVTNSDGPTRTIYFEPPIPTGVVDGETIELYNFRGRGTTVDQYNGAINDAISIARDNHALIPHVVELDDPYNQRIPQLTIPDSFASFAYIQFTDRRGYIHALRPQSVKVDRLTRTVSLLPRYTSGYHGLVPTIVGYAQPELLASDDDETAIEVEWLYNEVKAQILERMLAAGMPVGSQDRLYLQERTEAGGKRPVILTRAASNTVRLLG